MNRSYPPMILADDFVEHVGVAWRIEPGRKHPVAILEPEFPWDAGATFSHGTTLKDPIDGLYKAWYLSTPRFYHERQLTYAQSEDGVTWTKPMLDIYPSQGFEKTNILLGSAMGGPVSQVSVFIHPDAEPSRRYEMFCYRDPCYEGWKTPGYGNPTKRIAGLPLPPGHDHHFYGLYRHFSPDGLHWTPEGDPIAGDATTCEAYGGRPFISSDGLSVFQRRGGGYVIHNKVELAAIPGGYVPYDVGCGCCRTVARRESDDGWNWSRAYENILTPDWRDPADTQFMELMINPYNEGFVGVATVYHNIEQTIDLQLVGSNDGVKWFRPGRRPAVSLEPLGDVGGGMLWPQRGFVYDGDEAHLYYSGLKGLHGDIYSKEANCASFEGSQFRASWTLGRMWAAVSHTGNDEMCYMTARSAAHHGKTLFVNAVSRDSGRVEAEMVDDECRPIAGYRREECIPVSGDQLGAPLKWKNHPTADCDKALLRLYLTDAFLYGYEWR